MCWIATVAAFPTAAVELARFDIREPLGQTWSDEWLTQEITVDFGQRPVPVGTLHLLHGDQSLPVQFYSGPSGVFADPDRLVGELTLPILFRATIPKNETVSFRLVADPDRQRDWPAVQWNRASNVLRVQNGVFRAEFNLAGDLTPISLRATEGQWLLRGCVWPDGTPPIAASQEVLETGPARLVVRRTFHFLKDRRYTVTFDIRAGDPWLDVTDSGSLGAGTAITFDLRHLNPDTVYHPYAYNARTFRAGGPQEDSTLQPPQHPIATLGPIWRDIWYNGGPFAFVYRTNSAAGIGFAAVRGSEWRTVEGVTPESQNLEIHGDADQPGQVWLRLPTDGVIQRRWALIAGPPELRQRLSRLTRSHADIPFDRVRKDWVLDWESAAPQYRAGAAGTYLGGHYNQHFFNPTTFPRAVRRAVDGAFKQFKHVKSRDLAVLAYVFSDPNYWPGPEYQWTIGNPNFHTDMYNIPLKIGLLMPDHPHAARWVANGVKETYGNLMRDSYPKGAWAESLSYSAFFFHVAENVRRLADYGVTNGFKSWPRMKEVATYLAAMHTPVDPRYGRRQKAPIGDTSPGNYCKELNQLAASFAGVDDGFAEQLRRFPERWDGALNLGSRAFPGFGAMLRGNAYDDRHESFVAIKAGPARNHYQGDELSFHFCSLGTPLAIDHACHYSPRPWSASIHNRPDMNGKRPVAVAEPRAFQASAVADVLVADERTTRINEVPLEPHWTVKPGWEYPTTYLPEDQPWLMRRYVMLVKHDPRTSRLADYLVVRDEIIAPEPVWWNLHLLARSIEGTGPGFRFPGQLDVDVTAHFLSPAVGAIEQREWGWSGNGGQRRDTKGDAYVAAHFSRFIPSDFERGTWQADDGERTVWLRVRGDAGATEWLVVLVPHRQGEPAPAVEQLSPTSARVTLGHEHEVIHLGTGGQYQAAVEREEKTTVLLPAGQLHLLRAAGAAEARTIPSER